MRKRLEFTLAIVLLLAMTGTTMLQAQAYGRVVLKIADSSGEPVVGAKITVTCEELPQYLDETATKKRGQASLAFADATKVYQVKIEKEGYVSQEFPLKAELRITTEREIVLKTRGEAEAAAASAAAAQAGAPRRFTKAESLFNEGVGLLQGGNLASAEAKFKEAIVEDEDLAPAYSALAAVYLEQERPEEAIATANKFLELSPDHPMGYRTLYDAYRALGDTENAEATLAKLTSVAESGDSAILFYNEGVEALKLGQLDAARERFEAALSADPMLNPAHLGLAKLDLDGGAFAGAAARAEDVLTREPENYIALLVRYEAYQGLGDSAKSSEAFSALGAAHPTRVGQLFYERGIELFNSGNASGAADHFGRALKANPELTTAHYHLGLSYVNLGQSEKAREHLQRFLELAPDDPEAASASEMLKYLGG